MSIACLQGNTLSWGLNERFQCGLGHDVGLRARARGACGPVSTVLEHLICMAESWCWSRWADFAIQRNTSGIAEAGIDFMYHWASLGTHGCF